MRRATSAPTAFAVIALVVATWSGPPPARAFEGDETRMWSMHNETRTQHGRHRLSYDPSLAREAAAHAARMRDAGEIFHSGPLYRSAPNYEIRGENVGFGSGVNTVYGYFLDSRSHFELIVDRDFDAVGIGTAWDEGTVFVSVLFGGRHRAAAGPRPQPPRASASAPAPAGAAASRGDPRGAPLAVSMLLRLLAVEAGY